MKKKSFVVIVIILILIIIGLCAFIVYDKDLLGLKKENNSNSEIVTKDKDSNGKLKVGSLGNNNSKIPLRMDDKFYFDIEDGKVVFNKSDGTKIIDSTIKDKVLQIALASSCDGSDARIAALTDKGEVFYNKIERFTDMSNDNFDYAFDFDKVIADEAVYGIENIEPKSPSTCGGTTIYAYVSKNNKRIVNVKKGKNNSYQEASLGHTYTQMYPYEDYIMYFELGGPMLLIEKDGKLIFNDDYRIDNYNIYLTYDNEYIYAKKVYEKSDNNQNISKSIIIGKDNSVYLMTLEAPTNDFARYAYSVEKTDKTFKTVEEVKNEVGIVTSATIEYTDGTKEKL